MSESASYRVLSPVTESSNQKARLAPPIPDLSGKTFCAMRHTFRADETFPLIEKLLREQYGDIKFVSNMELPDMKPTTPAEEAELARVLKEKGCDVLLSGNGA